MTNIIYPCLWFNGNAKEAATFYSTVFSNTKITSENPIVVTFESAGQRFMCLNGGPEFTFNPSISFFVLLENEEELDKAWNVLLEGGSVLMPLGKYDWSRKYGWVQDRFGVNWQLSFGKFQDVGQRFTPALLFTSEQHGNAEKAVQFYTSVFDNSSVVGILRYGKDDGDTEGTVKHAQFKLNDTVFMAMDSSLSHAFSFNEAISFVVSCKTQEEIDYYWSKLSEGGSEGQCGWLKDQFGVSWQIVPAVLGQLMSTPGKSERVMQKVMQMKKFDIAELEEA
ncbi:VOC family protein [Chitinophagaceae bacterium LB-8]|uniref:VOC family protein n=1 Tax=Paraflavisolibacter caeni TaxID=2982496 RepID=A0A9X2XPR7_9BACT|nr:VOC family protein [Paraflavisolibacter caeni]MCU7552013.1 VOC family protein [Paraflavisolibacter caeni]